MGQRLLVGWEALEADTRVHTHTWGCARQQMHVDLSLGSWSGFRRVDRGLGIFRPQRVLEIMLVSVPCTTHLLPRPRLCPVAPAKSERV